MDESKSPTSTLESTGDTSRLLKELMDLQKSTASSMASIDRSINLQDSEDNLQTISALVHNSGDATEPTLTELMKTIYDGSANRQLITLQGTDMANSFSVYGQEVDIVSSKQNLDPNTHSLSGSTGSNKVKITPVVKYDWENRHYVGNLVAVHRSNVFVAYVLKGKSNGVVRVTNRKTAERHLLKDFVGRVIDLAFAHSDDVLLSVVDEIGNLLIYELKPTAYGKISSSLLMHIQRGEQSLVSEYHRVIWCPYIPDDADDSSATDSTTQDNASRVLVLTNDEKAEIWSVDLVTKEYGGGPHYPGEIDVGLIQINSHTKPIMDAAFSPDGTALATASLDGEVKFFQVYMHDKSPRCLHQWKPHGGKPMSCLFFLDDHKNFSPDAQFWKFAVTGANNNQEIKIWSCESWNCLQTIRFLCPPGLPSNFSVDPCMKASIDLSAKYFILSDIKRNVLYILQIYQDGNQNTAHVSSVSEFTLAQPCLSFAILDARTKKFKITKGDDSHLDEITTGEIDREEGTEEDKKSEDNTQDLGVQIRLFTVHPKALQELLVRFKPESSVPQPPPPSVSSISQSETCVMDGLSDISMSIEGCSDHDKSDSFILGDSNISGNASHPILMTPDAFTSSPRKSYPDDSLLDSVRGSVSSTSSFTQVSVMNEDFLSPRSSSGSTIIQTPTTPKQEAQSPGMNTDTTPSSIPLPPVTNMEESELATPTSTPRESREYTEGEITPTLCTQEVEDMFSQKLPERKVSDLQQVSLDSTESTGMFEVTESRVHQKSQSSYDEMDEEVAEVMGDPDADTYSEGQPDDGTQPFQGTQVNESTDSSLRVWPKPPDVITDTDRQNSTQEPELNETEDNDDNDDDDDDVVVEEEEVEETVDDEDGDGEDGDTRDTGDRGDREKEEEEDEDIEEDIEEEQEEQDTSEENLENKRPMAAPVAAPVANTGFTASPREGRSVEIREIHKETVREVLDQKELQKLHLSMNNILSMMERQQEQLDELKRGMSEQQENYIEYQRRQLEQEQLHQVSQGTQQQPSIEEHLGKLENIVTSRVERLFTQHSHRENKRIEDILRQNEAREAHKQDRLMTTVTQTLTSTLTNNLEKIVRNTLIPNVTKSLEPMKQQIHQEMAQKLTATDSLLKDNIGKMVRSRQTVEAIGIATGNVIQAPIQAAYREAFQNLVIPSFERATQNMYQQVTDTFHRGTKEYTRQLESQLDGVRQKHLETRDPIVSELRKLTDSFQTSAEQMKSHVLATIQSQLSTEMQKHLTSMQDQLLRYVREAVRDEVSSAMQEHGSNISDSLLHAMRSGAVTPMRATPDPQAERSHILNLLQQGQLNAAFQQALSAANLELVITLCEAVNPSQVFNQSPCPLQQPVLLSLIQQLSADLESHTDLKHKYLAEAVMNLDAHDVVTQEHMKGVLYGLNQKLKLHIPAHPNDKTTRALRMLLMASESLIK